MRHIVSVGLAAAGLLALSAALALRVPHLQAQNGQQGNQPVGRDGFDAEIAANATRLFEEGRRIFRYDTFGDEAFWGDQLKLHQAIAGAANGGVGPGVSPKTALAVGLKVDAKALPDALIADLKAGKVDLDSPATTLALLKLDAVLGIRGFFDAQGGIRSIGIQCALCHSTVDDSVAPGIGKRLDGWAARDLNVGAIIALAPNLKPLTDLLGVDDATVRTVLNSWGPGRFDARLLLDGQAFRPDGKSAATLMGTAFGLAGVNQHTTTGAWGAMNYWNALVANLLMHGKGTFIDSRLADATQYPVAAKAGYAAKRDDEDLITGKLPALQYYQMSIPPPRPPQGSFNAEAAARGAVRGAGEVQHMPRPAALHRARTEPPPPRGDRHRRLPGRARAHAPLPHDAAAGPLDPPEGRLLPRRPLRDPSGCRQPLRRVLPARPFRDREERSGRVSEVVVSRCSFPGGAGRRHGKRG